MSIAPSQPTPTLPDHTQLPESDGVFVKNFQEHPQSLPWLRWWDSGGNLLLAGDERAEQERQRAERLAAKLRELGIDPESV